MPELFDPRKAREGLQEGRRGQPSAAEVVGLRRGGKATSESPRGPSGDPRDSTALCTTLDPLRQDFRVFLTLIWRHLGLPDPTPLQLSIAWFLQHGMERVVIMAFRGCAKSWITAAYALWTLYCDPQKKVLVVSASLKRSVAFTNFCLALIREVPQLRHLEPKPHQRQSSQAFDVGPATPDQTPSFHAAGITGQTTGFRADLIVADDVEVPSNSMTVLMREKLAEAVKEFDSILKPGGVVKFLGTPQCDDSLYNKLEDRGYSIRIWPARFPRKKARDGYGHKLAPFIASQIKADPTVVGRSTEPSRFSEEDLKKRELSLGKSTFALQFLLDTSLTDAERYPLKLRDLVVMGLDPKRGPDAVAWGNSEGLALKDLPAMGFTGDYFYGPANVAETFSPYNKIIAAVDSSGRGADETALAILAELHGVVYLLYTGAWRDGYGQGTLEGIAKALVRFNVSLCIIESNFGDGMFLNLLKPVVEEAWKAHNKSARKSEHGGTTLEEIRATLVQKELRILSVLEPVSQQHRLVVNSEVVENDYASIKAMDAEETRHRYSLWYQWTHLTRERDCLTHDDRLDAVAIGVAHYAPDLGVSPLGMAQRREEERLDEELEALFDEADEVGGWPRARRSSARPKVSRPNMRPGRSTR